MLGSVAAVVAGAVIVATGWLPIDPILSLFVSALILRSTWLLLRTSTQVLMEGVPAHLSYEDIGRALTRLPGVSAVHDLHVWHMTSTARRFPRICAFAMPARGRRRSRRRSACSRERFGIDHVTLQPTWHEPPAGKRVIPVTPVGETTTSRSRRIETGIAVAASEPLDLLELKDRARIDRHHHGDRHRIAPRPLELGHVLEVHAVDAGDHASARR